MTDDYIGQHIGHYRLLRPLGHGTFAEVYLAEHLYLEVLAAIKILHMRMGPGAHESFLNEARTIARLQHPHIVRVLDFGFQEQMPYLVMEYTPNGTLRSLHPRGTRVPFEQIVSYVKQIASALDYAHGQQMPVIHRDVKPENILLNAKHELVLSDFGIAVVRRTMSALSTHKMAGTPLYMAPEQIQGHPGPASDQYALGIMVYEWLCGEPPFHSGSLLEVCRQHIQQEAPSLCARLPHLPPAVEDAVFGALSKDPHQRFVSIEDFAMVLEEACFATQPLLSSTSIRQQAQQPVPLPTPASPPTAHVPDGANTTQPLPQIGGRKSKQRSLASSPPTPDQITTAPTRLLPPVHTNRHRLLRKVYSIWIDGVLEHSLHGAALLSLGLQEHQGAVASPWRLVLQQPDMLLHPLPVGTHITQVYDTAGGELLILGAPGSGKTTLLLELARDLLKRAESEEAHPIPVVFNLSTWAAKRQQLTTWFVEELAGKYQVPRKLGRSLVATEQILPLLDGLDEMPQRERTACIDAINSYRQEHGLHPLVICCRSADYLAQSERVQLGSAVVIQPLTEQQIDDYLARGGKSLRNLRAVLHQDVELSGLARTPLMLSVMSLAYQGQVLQADVRSGSALDRQKHIFSAYVQRMLERRGGETPYTKEQTMNWLTYLARQMQYGQAVFYIERMQPDWLEHHRDRQFHARITNGFIFGLVGACGPGPLSGLALIQMMHPDNVLLFMLFCSLLCGALFGLFNGMLSTHEEAKRLNGKIRWSWRRMWERSARALINGWLVGLLIGFPDGILSIQATGADGLFVSLAVMGVLLGLVGGLVFLLIDVFLRIQTEEIQPAETFAWSWAAMGSNLLKFVSLGVLGSLLIGLLLGVINSVYAWVNGASDVMAVLGVGLRIVRVVVLGFAPYILLIVGLLGMITGGWSSKVIAEHHLTTPNQGIRRSARSSLLVGGMGLLLGSVVAGLLGGIDAGQMQNLMWQLTFGLIFGSLIGLVGGLRVGGVACIQHMILRWLLRDADALPWRYAHFLDYAVERVLLSRVGGGYIFVHRLLLDYFASLALPQR